MMPYVYDDLRKLAAKVFRNENAAATLQPTALVNEAYLRLVRPREEGFTGRRHFMSVAAMAMRQILANQARDRSRLKRGGGQARITLGSEAAQSAGTAGAVDIDLVALNDALARLEALDAQLARVVELRYLAGLGVEEVAEILEVNERTVRRRWNLARAWLRQAMDESSS